MCFCVLCVCLSASISLKPLDQSSQSFVCRAPVVVAQSSSGGVVLRYVLPVLWMTSRLAVMGATPRSGGCTMQRRPWTRWWYWGGVWCLWMLVCFSEEYNVAVWNDSSLGNFILPTNFISPFQSGCVDFYALIQEPRSRQPAIWFSTTTTTCLAVWDWRAASRHYCRLTVPRRLVHGRCWIVCCRAAGRRRKRRSRRNRLILWVLAQRRQVS